jgi:SEFIR domain
MPRVFISYSHDDNDHVAQVHALADRLAGENAVDVILDRDTGPGGPDEGWPEWSERQVLEADYVLIACSEEYARRYEGNDDGSERGRGTVAETRTIRQFLYESKGRNARYRVVLFDSANEAHIPHQLRGYHWFNATEAESYTNLCAWLSAGIKDADAPNPEGPIWPEPDLKFKLPLADRRPHFAAVRAALSGNSTSRIFLFKGEGNSGKTQFLNELCSYTERINLPWTRFDFKGAPPLHEIFETILLDLGPERLPATEAASSNTPLIDLVNDLKKLTEPVLFLFDTFEKASDESKKWLESKFLPRIRNLPAVVVVIGGRSVPEKRKYPWKALADFRILEPIKNVEDWKEYLGCVHDVELETHEIETLTVATDGSPGTLRPLLETLAARRDSK